MHRIETLKEELLACGEAGYCTERAFIVTNAYRQNSDAPPLFQRAAAFRDILDQITIYIRPDELLMGNLSSQLGARPLYPEFHLGVAEHGKTGSVGEKIELSRYPELAEGIDFWRTNDSFHLIDEQRDETTRWMQHELIVNSAAEVNGHGHLVVDYEKIMDCGFEGLIARTEELEESAGNPQEKVFQQAMRMTLQAGIDFSKRYAGLCRELAEEASSSLRRTELLRMADVAERVPAKPPKSFHEALQFVYFVYLTLHQEHNGYSISFGRLDKILDPYYRADLEAGTLTRDEAFELICSFCIKVMELPIGGVLDTKTAVVTLGGIDAAGNYLCNEVSHLFLETIRELKLNAPAVIVRWHKNAPEDFKCKTIEILKYGTGYPGLFGDEAVIDSLVNEHGATKEEAHDWAEVGCAEVYVTGKSRPVDAGLVNLPVALVLAANNGDSILCGKNIGLRPAAPKEFTSIDMLLKAYEKVFTHLLDKEIELDLLIKGLHRDLRPVPFTSALMSSCMENGRDLLDGGEKFNLSCVGIFSMANLVDSLVAVEELVFKQGKYSMAEYLQILKKNFSGEGALSEELEALPRYGNNDERADRFIPLVNEIHYRARKQILGKYGVDVSYEAIPREVHIDLGLVSPATFDGRKQGEPFADGISAGQGRDTNGLTSLLQTVIKTNAQKHITNGVVLNLKFSPGMLASTDSLGKIRTALDVYFDHGGEQAQIISVNPEDLLAAQKAPEKYKDLIVRVAGFCAYFTTLRKELQDEIIARTIYSP